MAGAFTNVLKLGILSVAPREATPAGNPISIFAEFHLLKNQKHNQIMKLDLKKSHMLESQIL